MLDVETLRVPVFPLFFPSAAPGTKRDLFACCWSVTARHGFESLDNALCLGSLLDKKDPCLSGEVEVGELETSIFDMFAEGAKG